jgi:N-acetylmuramoyl-L-alanine amidase CwlA
VKLRTELLPVNRYSRPGYIRSSVARIVWHWTGAAGQRKETTARYFELIARQEPDDGQPDRYASSHYIVDEAGVLQVIPDEEVAYHAGAGWWNLNSIGIEICHPDASGRFPLTTLANLLEMSARLCEQYGIRPLTQIVRHHDVTGKLCPRWFVEHPADYEAARRIVSEMVTYEVTET